MQAIYSQNSHSWSKNSWKLVHFHFKYILNTVFAKTKPESWPFCLYPVIIAEDYLESAPLVSWSLVHGSFDPLLLHSCTLDPHDSTLLVFLNLKLAWWSCYFFCIRRLFSKLPPPTVGPAATAVYDCHHKHDIVTSPSSRLTSTSLPPLLNKQPEEIQISYLCTS